MWQFFICFDELIFLSLQSFLVECLFLFLLLRFLIFLLAYNLFLFDQLLGFLYFSLKSLKFSIDIFILSFIWCFLSLNICKFSLRVLEYHFEWLLLFLERNKLSSECLTFIIELWYLSNPFFGFLWEFFSFGLDLLFELGFHFDSWPC